MNDLISRQAVKDLFCRICMESNLCYRSKETCEDLKLFDKLPSVKPQEPSNDLISRQAVIDALEQSINILDAVDRVMDMPSVSPFDDAKYHLEHGEVIVAKELWEDAEKALKAVGKPYTHHNAKAFKECQKLRQAVEDIKTEIQTDIDNVTNNSIYSRDDVDDVFSLVCRWHLIRSASISGKGARNDRDNVHGY